MPALGTALSLAMPSQLGGTPPDPPAAPAITDNEGNDITDNSGSAITQN